MVNSRHGEVEEGITLRNHTQQRGHDQCIYTDDNRSDHCILGRRELLHTQYPDCVSTPNRNCLSKQARTSHRLPKVLRGLRNVLDRSSQRNIQSSDLQRCIPASYSLHKPSNLSAGFLSIHYHSIPLPAHTIPMCLKLF